MKMTRRKMLGILCSFPFAGCAAAIIIPPVVVILYELLDINEKNKTVTYDSIKQAVDYQVDAIIKIKRDSGKKVSPKQIENMKQTFLKQYEEELEKNYNIIYENEKL